ncbi:MAG: xylose isomerase, partial [Armatimonadota bacterium]
MFLVLFGDRGLEEALDLAAQQGIEAVELGAGGYPGSAHLDVERMLTSSSERKRLLNAVRDRGMIISALSCHGNPLHPQKRLP